MLDEGMLCLILRLFKRSSPRDCAQAFRLCMALQSRALMKDWAANFRRADARAMMRNDVDYFGRMYPHSSRDYRYELDRNGQWVGGMVPLQEHVFRWRQLEDNLWCSDGRGTSRSKCIPPPGVRLAGRAWLGKLFYVRVLEDPTEIATDESD